MLWLTALNFSVHFRLLNNDGGGIFIRAHFHSLCVNNYAAVVSSSASNCFVQSTFGDSVEKAMLKRYHTISSYQILRNSIKQLMSP